MTRDYFNMKFAATEANTEGFSAAELAEINDRVFAMVEDCDHDAQETRDYVQHVFERAFNEFIPS